MTQHDCDDYALPAHTRCPACGAHRVHCAECGTDLTEHELAPCPAA